MWYMIKSKYIPINIPMFLYNIDNQKCKWAEKTVNEGDRFF